MSYSAESVFDALHFGILGAASAPETRAYYVRLLETGSLEISALVQELLGGRRRQRPYFTADQAIDAVHFASLGRLPDAATRGRLAEQIEADPTDGVLINLGKALYGSAEHQDRMLPANVAERVLVDHSPNGEFMAMLRLFLGANGRGHLVEVGLPTPNSSYSRDFLALSGWRGIVVEPSLELGPLIEARFSGLDFELIPARVGAVAELETERQAIGGFDDLGFDKDEDRSSLATVLTEANVPTDFEVLSISSGVGPAELINNLIRTSDYRPALVIAELKAPLYLTDLSQLGLSAATARNYELGLSTERSIFLVRR